MQVILLILLILLVLRGLYVMTDTRDYIKEIMIMIEEQERDEIRGYEITSDDIYDDPDYITNEKKDKPALDSKPRYKEFNC